jgi:3-dehydroquinate dehydratase-1
LPGVKKISWNAPLLFIGTVSTAAGLRLLKAPRTSADVIEVRVDALRQAGVPDSTIEAALRGRKHPVLLTLRIRQEGGEYAWRARERIDLFLKWIPLVDAVDIELAAVRRIPQVLACARRLNKSVVLSAHSIQRRPSAPLLRQWCAAFRRYRVRIYKIAARVKSRSDLHRLASILIEQPRQPWAVMGVGPGAAVSRRVLAGLGSRLAYGYLDRPAAPGQPSVRRLREALGA